MAIELIETNSDNAQMLVKLHMACIHVIVSFYSNDHCTVLVEYADDDDSVKSVFTVHRRHKQEVKAVEAALRIATNFEGTGSEDDYKLAESIMPTDPAARWIP